MEDKIISIIGMNEECEKYKKLIIILLSLIANVTLAIIFCLFLIVEKSYSEKRPNIQKDYINAMYQKPFCMSSISFNEGLLNG